MGKKIVRKLKFLFDKKLQFVFHTLIIKFTAQNNLGFLNSPYTSFSYVMTSDGQFSCLTTKNKGKINLES